MMQFADMGAIATLSETENQCIPNQKLIDYLTKKLTEEEEFKTFGVPECASMRERIAMFIFQQVAVGLEYLHETAFVANRDLKPDNILFATKSGGTNIYKHDRAQITDFTTVFKMCKDTADIVKVSGFQGTPVFQAPECSTLNEYHPRPLDVWAFGVSLYAFMFDHLPFWGTTESEVIQKVQNDEV